MSAPKKHNYNQEHFDSLLTAGKKVHHATAMPAYAFTCKCNVKQLIPINLLNRPSLCSNCGCIVHVHAPKDE